MRYHPTVEKIQSLLLWFVPFLFSLSFHESAHAWVASKLGDVTAKNMGRVSLNPIVHSDPIGTFLMPILGFLTSMPLIGWANPVPVVERNLRNPQRDGTLVALAGPASNLILGCIFAFTLYLLNHMPGNSLSIAQAEIIVKEPLMIMATRGVQLNMSLALFNLLPMPPLDGGRILYGLVPAFRDYFYQIQRYSLIIFLVLIMTNVLTYIVFYPAMFMTSFLLHLAGVS